MMSFPEHNFSILIPLEREFLPSHIPAGLALLIKVQTKERKPGHDGECCLSSRQHLRRISWEVGFWACLWGFISMTLIEVERPALCGCHHSLAGNLDCIHGERGWATVCIIHLSMRMQLTTCFKCPLPVLPLHDELYPWSGCQNNPFSCFYHGVLSQVNKGRCFSGEGKGAWRGTEECVKARMSLD